MDFLFDSLQNKLISTYMFNIFLELIISPTYLFVYPETKIQSNGSEEVPVHLLEEVK